MTFLTLQEPHDRLTVTAMSHVEVVPVLAPAPSGTAPWDAVAARVRGERTADTLGALEFLFESPHVRFDDDVRRWAAPSFPPGRPVLEGVLDLTHRLHADFAYDPEATTVATPVAEVLRARRGVCQDFAHLEIAWLRALGLPARYVSGYIETVPRAGRAPPGGGRRVARVAGGVLPGHGWVDVDPTNDQVPEGRHVTVAWGRDYGDVVPIKGVVLGGDEHTMQVAVDVTPLG